MVRVPTLPERVRCNLLHPKFRRQGDLRELDYLHQTENKRDFRSDDPNAASAWLNLTPNWAARSRRNGGRAAHHRRALSERMPDKPRVTPHFGADATETQVEVQHLVPNYTVKSTGCSVMAPGCSAKTTLR